jgi:IS30 family transposase
MNPKGRLTIEEREQIALMLAKDYTYMQIASTLQRAPSTIGREVYRNYSLGGYRAVSAHSKAKKRQRNNHQRPLKVESNPLVSSYIYEKMQLLWSPYQISKQMTKDIGLTVSHETIYQYIYVQTKGELKKELTAYLRQRKPRRQSRKLETEKRGTIPDMISISQRPAEVEDRIIPGHWEGDLIVGKDHKSAIGTLVERTTRYCLLVHLEEKDAESVRKAFAKKIKELPRDLVKTLTYDRGKEMTQHKKFTMDTKMQVYFCDPHSPWQRGTNENTNGLVRGFFPKGTDFNLVTKEKLNWVQNALNERPRQTLGFNTPKETFNSLLLNL